MTKPIPWYWPSYSIQMININIHKKNDIPTILGLGAPSFTIRIRITVIAVEYT